MSSQGESRRGTTLLVAVIVVSMIGLVGHLSRYAGLAAGRLGVTTAAATPSPHPPATPRTSTTPGTPKPPTTTMDAVTIPVKCTRRDNPPTTATFPTNDHFSRDLTDYGSGAEL